jgi:3-dehydroquinate synthase
MKTLSTHHYDIKIGEIKDDLNHLLSKEKLSNICVIVDENTKEYCLPILEKYFDHKISTILIHSGEENKTISTCQEIWSKMMDMKLGRNSLVINLGGGVIGDMGGFCASTFKRGMRFIQIPTTLLSQVDASVGGKLGIDFKGVKNSIGIFNDPECVFIHPLFLETLPQREIRSGFAEIIKHCLIADKVEWQNILTFSDLKDINWADIIYRSVQIKQRIVIADPYEKGIRKALNFGHTIGHAIESVFLEKKAPLLHGEAIAIGMICEAFISSKKINLFKIKLDEISNFIIKIYGKIELNKSDYSQMINLMRNDKKNENENINFSLISSIGDVEVNQTASKELIVESLNYYSGL